MLIMICTAWSWNENPSNIGSNWYQKPSRKQSQGGFCLLHSSPWVWINFSDNKGDVIQRDNAWHLEIQDQWGSLVICTLDARTHILQLRKYFQSWCRLVFKAHLSSTSLKPRQRLQLSSLELVDVLPQESLWHKPVWRVWSTVTSWFPSGKFRVLTSNMYLVSSTQLKNQESLARANINQALIFTSTCPLGACEEQGTCLTKLHPALGLSQRCLGMTLTPWSLHGLLATYKAGREKNSRFLPRLKYWKINFKSLNPSAFATFRFALNSSPSPTSCNSRTKRYSPYTAWSSSTCVVLTDF